MTASSPPIPYNSTRLILVSLLSDLTPKLVSLPRRVRPLSQQTLWVFCLSESCGV